MSVLSTRRLAHVATSSFTLNFTEESSDAVVSSLITARRLWPEVQTWSVKVPTTNGDSGKLVVVSCFSSIASLGLSSTVQFNIGATMRNMTSERCNMPTNLIKKEHDAIGLPSLSIRLCWQSHPTNYILKFAVLRRGDDFSRQICGLQGAQAHQHSESASLFLVARWKSAKERDSATQHVTHLYRFQTQTMEKWANK